MTRDEKNMFLDPELAAASVLLERPDIGDHIAARANLISLRETTSAGCEQTVGRVSWRDERLEDARSGTSVGARIYVPTHSRGSIPAVVFFHGGAFVIGDLDSEHARCLRYAADAGCVVVSVDYRLAPEDPFPAAFDDAYAGLVWTSEHADELGIDASRIAIAGSSAGGALAASVAQAARDRRGPFIALQFLLYPVIDDSMGSYSMRKYVDTPVLDGINCAAMWKQYGGGKNVDSKYFAPGRESDLANLPPACILTAGYDPLRDEGLLYAQRLMSADVPVELHHYASAYHAFDQIVPGADITHRALDQQVHWLREFLRP
jgi:acetyl esterase